MNRWSAVEKATYVLQNIEIVLAFDHHNVGYKLQLCGNVVQNIEYRLKIGSLTWMLRGKLSVALKRN